MVYWFFIWDIVIFVVILFIFCILILEYITLFNEGYLRKAG